MDSDDKAGNASDIWTQDGVYDIGSVGRKTGRDEITDSFKGFHVELVHGGCAHFLGSPYIRLDGDRATALHYSVVFRADGEDFKIWRVSANEWQLVCENGEWRVKVRTNRLLNGEEEARLVFSSIHALEAKEDRL